LQENKDLHQNQLNAINRVLSNDSTIKIYTTKASTICNNFFKKGQSEWFIKRTDFELECFQFLPHPTSHRKTDQIDGLLEHSQLAPGQPIRDVLEAQVANFVAFETVICESECGKKDLACKGKRALYNKQNKDGYYRTQYQCKI
jgi:hypothetical protein